MKPFPAEDRELYPEMFRIPDGVYEVRMAKPLGIVFEELEAGGGGVYVTDLVEGGNAESQGIVKPGDKLIGVTAIKVSKFSLCTYLTTGSYYVAITLGSS